MCIHIIYLSIYLSMHVLAYSFVNLTLSISGPTNTYEV